MAKFGEIKGTNDVFKTPDDYFENLTSEIHTKMVEENLKEKFGNKSPFSVPEGYFENMKGQAFVKPIGFIRVIKPYISVAAAIIILAGIWQIFITNLDINNYSKVITDTSNKNSLYTDNLLNLNKIEKSEIDETAELYMDLIDNETIFNLSESLNNQIVSQNVDESVYDYFVDYDSGLDYVDYVIENNPKTR
jgi:hypothetical protein